MFESFEFYEINEQIDVLEEKIKILELKTKIQNQMDELLKIGFEKLGLNLYEHKDLEILITLLDVNSQYQENTIYEVETNIAETKIEYINLEKMDKLINKIKKSLKQIN